MLPNSLNSTRFPAPIPGPLPIFGPKTSKKTNPRRVHQAKIGAVSIPLTEEEHRALLVRLNQHTETHGVKYGFFASLLGEAANYVSPGL